jgi:hypothetical protein
MCLIFRRICAIDTQIKKIIFSLTPTMEKLTEEQRTNLFNEQLSKIRVFFDEKIKAEENRKTLCNNTDKLSDAYHHLQQTITAKMKIFENRCKELCDETTFQYLYPDDKSRSSRRGYNNMKQASFETRKFYSSLHRFLDLVDKLCEIQIPDTGTKDAIPAIDNHIKRYTELLTSWHNFQKREEEEYKKACDFIHQYRFGDRVLQGKFGIPSYKESDPDMGVVRPPIRSETDDNDEFMTIYIPVRVKRKRVEEGDIKDDSDIIDSKIE